MAQGSTELLKMLAEIDPKQPYGTPLFDALARLMPIDGPEAVCIRNWKGEVQVYLTQRAADDTAYPGQWHAPGSIIRIGEEFDDVFARLEKREFGCRLVTKKSVGPPLNNAKEVRGHAVSIVFLCEMEGQDTKEQQGKGRWFSVEKLPEPMVEWHRTHVIPEALKAFQNK